MNLNHRRELRQNSRLALECAPGEPKKTVLAYAGITALLSFAVTLLTFLLDKKIDTTGGLGNLGLRSVLQTIRYIMPLALNIALLGLSFGYCKASVAMSRRQSTRPAALLEGFQHFGSLVRLAILEVLIYVAIAFVAMYLGAQIFMMTPLAADFYEIMMPLVSSTTALDSTLVLDEATLLAATKAMMPMIPIFLGLFLLAAVPIYYQYRMCRFVLADEPRQGAIVALRTSRNIMRRNRFALFKLDLSFWWFYLAEVLIGIIGYADLLLPMLGVDLPFSASISSFLFYIISLALQTALYAVYLNQVQVTYATAYNQLRPQPQEPTKVALGNIFQM